MRLFQRKNGYWYVRFSRKKVRSLHTKDKYLANRLFREIQREYLRGKLLFLEKDTRITLSEFRKEYVDWGANVKAYSTVKRDELSLRRLQDVLGDVSLKGVGQREVERYISFMRELGRKPAGINVDLRHLKAAFNKAIEWGYIKSNPFSKIKPLKVPTSPPRFLSEDEMERVFEAIKGTDFEDIVRFTVMTGCRRREICNLKVRHVNFRMDLIELQGKGSKKRIIPLTPELKRILKERCKGRGLDERVFGNFHPDSLSRKWIRLMKRLGLNYRFHDLRHTFASYLAMSGISLSIIRDILGHSSVSVTQIYAHLRPEILREAMEEVSLKLKGVTKIFPGKVN